MAHQFIVTMRDLRRVHPPDKEVLRGINISMYPGAKIGVLGLNGSGKSTLLRILAGEDDGYSGEVRVTKAGPNSLVGEAVSGDPRGAGTVPAHFEAAENRPGNRPHGLLRVL